MKRMENYLPYIGLIFILLGTFFTAWATKNYQGKTISGQAEIKAMNLEIDGTTKRIEKLNSEIGISTDKTKVLTEVIEKVSLSIDEAQTKILKIAEYSSNLTEHIIDLETGGDSYLKFGITYVTEKSLFVVKCRHIGNHGMKNVSISIQALGNCVIEVDKTPHYKDKFTSFNDKKLNLFFPFIGTNSLSSWYSLMQPVALIIPKELDKSMLVLVLVESANGITEQMISVNNIRETELNNANKNCTSKITRPIKKYDGSTSNKVIDSTLLGYGY